MNLKNKILIIIGFCTLVSVGSFFIIKMMFDNFEKQLMEKCRIEVFTGAKIMTDLIHIMIDYNVLTENDVFDTNYIQIPGTNPPKFNTKYDAIFDQKIQQIEDEFLRDQDVIFAVLIDKNGYVPTHNSKFSKPATNDKNHNLQFSRSKRNFSNSPGIRSALISKGEKVVEVSYSRDTGESVWIMGFPVYIKQKHWGAFIIGVSLDRVNEIKNQMIILISAVMFVILSLTILSLIAIMPRTLFNTDMNIPKY